VKESNNYESIYVGSYTTGESKGITKVGLLKDGTFSASVLVAESENPSFITFTKDQKYLLATNEVDIEGTGTIESFEILEDSLVLINRELSGGAHPCFISANKDGYVLTSNYSGGNIGLHQLNKGKLSVLLDTANHIGKGNHPRQDAPHAHSAWFVPNDSLIIAVDLGTNELWFYCIDKETNQLKPFSQSKLLLPQEAGPRHLCFHPNGKWIYVLNELSNTISLVIRNITGTFILAESFKLLPTDFMEYNTAAHIVIASDGKFIYASNRGHNSIAIFGIDQENGTLYFVAHESTHGTSPRHFALSPNEEFMIVANMDSDNLVSFKRDKKTGLLSYLSQTRSPTPVCVLFE
jgi:6-phosphogluconolactonase